MILGMLENEQHYTNRFNKKLRVPVPHDAG